MSVQMREKDRYRPRPTVMDALRYPKLFTKETLAGIVVGLALIPEAIAFALAAGVPAEVGLFSAIVMAISISFLGGRPAMITGATAAVALVVKPVAEQYNVDYLIAAVILGGIFQVILGALGVGKLMRFIPRSVMVGFVNALAILIALAQLEHFKGASWMMYPMIAVSLVILWLFPKLTKAIPAPLVVVIVMTMVVWLFGFDVKDVAALSGEEGLPGAPPLPFFPDVPLTVETLQIIAPYALGVAAVGLMESLMTAKLVDEITDTHSSKTREAMGQGGANILSGLFGGMGGCAMIGQTMINVRASGARTRVSTFMAGVFLLIMVWFLGPIMNLIPIGALVAIMFMVAFLTLDWHSIAPSTLKRMPKSETIVMLVTVIPVLITHNLSIGVIIGVFVAAILFVRRVAHFTSVSRTLSSDGKTAHYSVDGELFFASSNDLTTQFEYADDPEKVIIDMSKSHVWDASTVAALDGIEQKFREHESDVEIVGFNDASSDFHGRLTGNLPSH
ncbi:sulfate permease, SulP family [Brevibacterium sandarakinum]|uniref:Sulfate permease, SulP family n=1 Tax=Brevibacterium sandarakinum TaxID=629680 RepID=A0A1H1RN47_BRESA|nr:SulP family inorganic anion transporter [Brevibacterium sandarakinum]SDS37053.1 sulfate permease, SulP family [Brevibacterium sandarakinum]